MGGTRMYGRLCRWGGAVALTALLLAGCGGGSTATVAAPDAQTPQAAPQVTARSTPMGVLVPLYGYPLVSSGSGASYTTEDNPAWTQVAAGAALVPTVAIINPSNGPVACTSPPSATLAAFEQGIGKLRAAGVTVLGYVHTLYGNRDAALVDADVQTYAQCYDVDGVFFDEVSIQASKASYYALAAATVRADIKPSSGKAALVAINPGTYPDSTLADSADITVMHESADLNLAALPTSLSSYPTTRFAYLALGLSELPQLQTSMLSSLYQRGIGYVDLTDQGAGNDPWATLSTQYSAMIQTLHQLNQGTN
ncbi:MAG: spherulation-specific family 4 protein [Pseudomonadota bacterium]